MRVPEPLAVLGGAAPAEPSYRTWSWRGERQSVEGIAGSPLTSGMAVPASALNAPRKLGALYRDIAAVYGACSILIILLGPGVLRLPVVQHEIEPAKEGDGGNAVSRSSTV